jgi:hypothetical protein
MYLCIFFMKNIILLWFFHIHRHTKPFALWCLNIKENLLLILLCVCTFRTAQTSVCTICRKEFLIDMNSLYSSNPHSFRFAFFISQFFYHYQKESFFWMEEISCFLISIPFNSLRWKCSGSWEWKRWIEGLKELNEAIMLHWFASTSSS